MSECMVYKYVYDDEIIYIGKTDSNVARRIYAHKTEEKFLPYVDNCTIYCAECKNPAHTAILEAYLINKYKPKLNKSMKYDDDLGIKIEEPEWSEYTSRMNLLTANTISKMPKQIRNDKQLLPSDIIVLAALLYYKEDDSDWIEASLSKLASFCGSLVNSRTIKRVIPSLENIGYIEILRSPSLKPNKYRILIPIQEGSVT